MFDERTHSRQSGQATIEMALVLAISVIIALGLVYRFNTAFKKYTVDMFGTYYRCLLETGELPGVGAVCSDKKMRFDIANGSTLVKNVPGSAGNDTSVNVPGSGGSGGSGSSGSGSSGSGKGGSGGSGSSGSGSQTKSGSGSGDSSGGSGSGGSSETVGASSSGSGGGRGSVVGRLSRASRSSRSTAVGSTSGSGAGDGADKDKPEPLSAYSSSGSRSGSDGLRRAQTKMDFKMDGSEYQRAETSAVSAVSASSVKKAEKAGDSLRPRKVEETAKRAVASKENADKGGGLEFGRMFRLFLIFAIIVGIIIFLGGQLLQISKGGEQ